MRNRILVFSSLFAAVGVLPIAAAPDWVGRSESAFIQVHRDTAVDWMPWSSEALQRAADEDLPVFLHIGYYTSELSRAMAEQTFSNPDTAKTLNENFVNILVDAIEHPEVADLHQAYIREEKQLNGWPVNVWLTPEMKPIEGAAYLPPSEEWGQPGVINVLERTLSAWQSDPEGQRARAADVAEHLDGGVRQLSGDPGGRDRLQGVLDMGIESWGYRYDEENRTFGDPPQHLNPDVIRALLAGSGKERDMAAAVVGAMADGAIQDHIGGGFFRQSISGDWDHPYFQKTLTDQALMVHALLDAAQATGEKRFTEDAARTIEFVLREMGDPSSGFIAAIDATSPTRLAAHFWTTREINSELGRRNGASFAAAHGITETGNIKPDMYLGGETEGRNLPVRKDPTAGDFSDARAKLLEARSNREAPARASAAPSGAHGLLLGALSRAGKELNDERFQAAAVGLLEFIRSELSSGGTLLRVKGADTPASPHDLALVADGLLNHFDATGDDAAKEWAAALQTELDEYFFDAASGRYFASRSTGSGIWARTHVPAPGRGEPASVEATAVLNLVRLGSGEEKTSPLARSIAIEIEESYDPAAGGDLLALQTHLKN